MTGFPLFRLPLVPLRSTLNMMDLSERIQLSMCSKKTHRFTKAAGKPVSLESFSKEQKENMSVLDKINLLRLEIYIDSQEFFQKYRTSLEINISDDLKYYFKFFGMNSSSTWIAFTIHVDPKHKKKKCEGTKGYLKTADATFPVVMKTEKDMYTFWKEKLIGFKIIGDWLDKTFKPQIDIKIKGGPKNDYSENLQFVADWVESSQKAVQYCTVNNVGSLNYAEYKFVMDKIHPIVSFKLIGVPNYRWSPFSTIFSHNPRFKSNHLKLTASWFTLENLYMTECRDIWLYESILTYKELTEYLIQWLTGRFTFLERLHVETKKEFDFENITIELPNSYVKITGKQRNYSFTRDKESISLQRKDGMVAKILTPNGKVNTFDMSISDSCIVLD